MKWKLTKNKNKINKKLKIGLALSGGGAKGICHIGVLKAFEEEGITFDYIAGTSAGSLIGSAIAAGKTSEELAKIASTVKAKDVRKSKIFFMPSKTSGIEDLAQTALGGDIDFSDLKLPFVAVAVCLNTGKETVFKSGKVSRCVAASCSAPGFFVPTEIDGLNYVDGGLLNNLPTSVLRDEMCDVIIGVDLGASKEIGTDTNKTIDTLLASFRIMSSLNVKIGRTYADVVIKPDMSRHKATKLDDANAMIEEGYLSTKEKMPQILHILKHKKPINKRKLLKLKKIKQKKYKKQLKIKDRFDVYKEERED